MESRLARHSPFTAGLDPATWGAGSRQPGRAQPGPGAVVQAPIQINLWFNELLEEGFNSVAVIPREELNLKPGEQFNLIRGIPTVDPRDRTHLWTEVAPLPAGDYVVEWRVRSRDGHDVTGRFNFRVAGSI